MAGYGDKEMREIKKNCLEISSENSQDLGYLFPLDVHHSNPTTTSM